MSKICQSCGSSLNDEQKLCSNCGRVIDVESFSSVQTVENSEVQDITPSLPQQDISPDTEVETISKKPSTRLIIAIILIVLIIVGGIIGGIYLLTKDDDFDDEPFTKTNNSSYVDSESSKNDSSQIDSSKNDSDSQNDSSSKSSDSSQSSRKKTTVSNDLDPYGVFKASKYNRGYQIAIGTMMHGIETKDFSIFFSAYPECVGESIKGTSSDSEIASIMDEPYSIFKNYLGEGYKLNCETTLEEEFEEIEYEFWRDKYGNYYNANIEIEEGYNVTIKTIISNNGKTHETSIQVCCGRIKDKWYVLDVVEN